MSGRCAVNPRARRVGELELPGRLQQKRWAREIRR